MKLNQEKFHQLVSGYKRESIWIKRGQTKILINGKQKIIKTFDEYRLPLCKKAGDRLSNFLIF